MPDDPTPRADFFCWIQPEAVESTKRLGFGARAYWKFGTNMRPRIFMKVRIGGTIYRINMRPASKDSHPAKGILERYLATEAALRASDYGRTPDLPDEDEA